MKIHYTDEDAIRELLMGHSVEVIGPTSSLCGASETTMTDDEKLMNAWREMREGFHHSLNYDEMFAAIDRALADIPDTDIAYAAGCEAGYANG